MKIQFYRLIAIALNLLILLTFVGCYKNNETPLESKPVISTDVPVDDVKKPRTSNNQNLKSLNRQSLCILGLRRLP